jgi:hypothetical protein
MLIAEMQDFYFNRNAVSYRVVSYDVSFVNSKGYFKEKKAGAGFDTEVISAINNTKVGGSITFSNIEVRRKGVPNRILDGALMYTIK